MSSPAFSGALTMAVRRWLTPPPDPWPAEVASAVNSNAAAPLCTNCLAEQPPHRWFCAHCGFPNGDQIAVMPYLHVFVIGEALRKGVMGPPEKRRGVQLFLVLMSLAEYSLFAPVYWYWMYRRAVGRPINEERRPELTLDDGEA